MMDTKTTLFLTLSLIRLTSVAVFLDFYFSKNRQGKFLTLIAGWGFYALSAGSNLISSSPTDSWGLWYAILAFAGTAFIVLGALEYFFALQHKPWIGAGILLFSGVPLLLANYTPMVDMAAQLPLIGQFTVLFIFCVVTLAQHNRIINTVGHSYYWLLSIAVVSLLHALGYLFFYQGVFLALSYVFTVLISVLTLIFLVHLENNISSLALRQNEEKFRSIVEASFDGILLTDENGVIQVVNDAACHILGKESTELINRPLWEMQYEVATPERKHEITQEVIKRAVLSFMQNGILPGDSPYQERDIITPDGKIRTIQATFFPIRSEKGIMAASIMRDITEKKLREKQLEEYTQKLEDIVAERTTQLKESEALYRSLVETAPEGISLVDMEGNFIMANDRLAQMFGYENKTTLLESKVNSLDLVHNQDRQKLISFWQQVLESGNAYTFEATLQRKDESYFPAEISTSMIDKPEGTPYAYLIFARDISERKQLQEKLIQQEKLAVLGKLAGGVGHELRNPLGVIANAVYYLQAIQRDAPKKVHEYLKIIREETRIAEKIISDLLNFGRTGQAEREETSLPALIERVLDKYPPEDTISVQREFSDNLPTVYVDRQQIEQVLENVISNAIQAMPNGGTLSFTAQLEGSHVCLQVKDTGIGIPAQNLKRVFEPLFSTKPKGIGLGLAIAKRYMEINQGWLELSSQVNQGTVVSLFLPKTKDKTSAAK